MITDGAEATRFHLRLFDECLSRIKGKNPDVTLYGNIVRDLIEVDTGYGVLPDPDIQDLANEALEDFWDFMVDTAGRGTPRKLDDSMRKYPRGFWNSGTTLSYPGVGLPGVRETTLMEGLGTTVHHYDKLPDPVVWSFGHFDQGGVRCFIGSAEVREIDAISSVPSMPDLTTQEISSWVRMTNKGKDEWQRPLDPTRVLAIQKFADASSQNHILTPILLYAEPNRGTIDIDWENGNIRIDPSQFLHDTGVGFTDWKSAKDLRPLWIVDGQHRTRGMGTSDRGSKMRVPVILLAGGDHPLSMTKEAAAKLFTEINTFSVEIGYELKHFLSHRFKIPGIGSLDYEALNVGKPSSKDRRRANHYAYRLAAYISEEPGSPNTSGPGALERGVALAPRDAGQNIKKVRISLKKALDEIRKWFMDDSLYGPKSKIQNYTDARDEVSAFFRAMDVSLGANWTPTRGTPKAVLEAPNVVRYLLASYPKIREATRGAKNRSTILTESDFKKALDPITPVDWMDPGLRTITGEWSSRWFANWVVDAVEHGQTYKKREVRSADPKLGVLPGRGIKAPPGDPTVLIPDPWPSQQGQRMQITVTPALNAVYDQKLADCAVRVNNNHVSVQQQKDGKRGYILTLTCSNVPAVVEVTCSFRNPNNLQSDFSQRYNRP